MVAAIRLEDYGDKIEGILLGALAEPGKGPDNNSNLQDPLATSKWDKVPGNLSKYLHEFSIKTIFY